MQPSAPDTPAAPANEQHQFGPFCLAPAERLLLRDGIPVEIGGRSLALLTCLVEQPGRVVSKRELLSRVWPDVVVEEGSLRFHMTGLRKLLGDGAAGARYITTQVGVGYAFVAQVRRLLSTAAEPAGGGAAPERSRPLADRLPAAPAHLIGRERDMRLLADRLAGGGLLTLVGPAGVGKTTLATAAAHAARERWGGRVSFVDLTALENPALVSSAIAQALGITVQGDDPLAVVIGHLRNEQRLLLLDNCEHLIDAVAAIVERLHEAAPGVRILATSREPLRVRGEQVHRLGALDHPAEPAGLPMEALLAYPAVELFVERASAGNSALTIDADGARLIAGMCRRLEGMALPIELAAVRAATHGLASTAQLLGDRLSLGWKGRRTAQARQQTLQAALDWSYELLSEAERVTLERLSVFPGPFPIDAALRVVPDANVSAQAAADALDALTAKSLVVPDRFGDAGAYRLMEMTRTYARERWLARGPEDHAATARRHALDTLRRLGSAACRSRQADDGGAEAAEAAHPLGNLRSALEWSFGTAGDLSVALPLAGAGAAVFMDLSLLAECRGWCERALERMPEADRGGPVEVELQAALGLALMFTRGNGEAVEQALERALEVAVGLGDRWNQLRILGRLHVLHERTGDFDRASQWAERATMVAAAIGAPEAIAVAASLAAISRHLAGDQPVARRELEQALRDDVPWGRERTVYYGVNHRNRSTISLARTLWLLGHADQARQAAERSLAEAVRLRHPVTHCIALLWTVTIYLWRGDLDDAEATLETLTRTAEVNAFGPYTAASLGFRGKLAVQRGQAGEALDWLQESLARLHAVRHELLTTSFNIALIQGCSLEGRHADALDLVNQTIARCLAAGERFALPELLRLKARACEMLPGSAPAGVEALLLESLASSERQGAKAWSLKTATDLARFRLRQGRRDEALAVLAPLRQAFAEGFGTEDLAAADQVLGELSAARSPR
jgi:predicted ATPase/DNA-binding winged helix-turn-helix (wHTH) protein